MILILALLSAIEGTLTSDFGLSNKTYGSQLVNSETANARRVERLIDLLCARLYRERSIRGESRTLPADFAIVAPLQYPSYSFFDQNKDWCARMHFVSRSSMLCNCSGSRFLNRTQSYSSLACLPCNVRLFVAKWVEHRKLFSCFTTFFLKVISVNICNFSTFGVTSSNLKYVSPKVFILSLCERK